MPDSPPSNAFHMDPASHIRELARTQLGIGPDQFDLDFARDLKIPPGVIVNFIDEASEELDLNVWSASLNQINSINDFIRFARRHPPLHKDEPMPEGVLGALLAAKPLDDPIRHWGNFYIIIFAINTIISIYLLLGDVSHLPQDVMFVAFVGNLVIMLMSTYVVYLLVRPLMTLAFDTKRVIFLRAFSRDAIKDDRELRLVLRSALPPFHTLSGIRAPRYRTIPLWNLLGGFFKAFRYMGTENFELEAKDKNWLARLLATLAESRAIILDARTLTSNVHDEIRLMFRLAETGRLYILVDDSHDPATWRAMLETATGGDPIDHSSYQLLEAPRDQVNRVELARRWRSILSSIPLRSIRVTPSALKFAREKVPAGDWKTPFWHNPAILSTAIIIAEIGFLALNPGRMFWVAMGIGIFALVMQCVAGSRLWASGQRQLALGGTPTPDIPMMKSAKRALFVWWIPVAAVKILVLFLISSGLSR